MEFVAEGDGSSGSIFWYLRDRNHCRSSDPSWFLFTVLSRYFYSYFPIDSKIGHSEWSSNFPSRPPQALVFALTDCEATDTFAFLGSNHSLLSIRCGYPASACQFIYHIYHFRRLVTFVVVLPYPHMFACLEVGLWRCLVVQTQMRPLVVVEVYDLRDTFPTGIRLSQCQAIHRANTLSGEKQGSFIVCLQRLSHFRQPRQGICPSARDEPLGRFNQNTAAQRWNGGSTYCNVRKNSEHAIK